MNLPDHIRPTAADVPAAEAWLVEFYEGKRNAVKDGDDRAPWNTINTGGQLSCVRNEDVTLIARLVPAPRDITSPADVKPGEAPAPADVKQGEAWIVKIDGERWVALKGGTDYLEWNAVNHGGGFVPAGNDDVILIDRLVPAHYNERNQ